jgi:hypothetical protein
MKKPKIITAFNDNPTYFSFVKSILQMWKNFGYEIKLGYISDNPNSDIVKYCDRYADLLILPRIKGIESGIQSKISRMILASEQSFFWITDVDLYILNIGWWENNFSLYNENNIIAEEKYSSGDKDKWPMWSNLGSGELLKSMINPEDLSYEKLILGRI